LYTNLCGGNEPYFGATILPHSQKGESSSSPSACLPTTWAECRHREYKIGDLTPFLVQQGVAILAMMTTPHSRPVRLSWTNADTKSVRTIPRSTLPMKYENLDIDIFDYQATTEGERFRVRVANSPAGEQRLADADGVFLTPALRDQQLGQLEQGQISQAELITLGSLLGDLLLPTRVRQFLYRSLAQVHDDLGLRIRLRLDTYALAGIPWEYIYLPDVDAANLPSVSNGFLALDPRISLVRYEVLGRAPGTLDPVRRDTLRMVTLLVSPTGLAALDLIRERRYIQDALQKVPGIKVEFYDEAGVEALEDALSTEAHIFHFAGHGAFEGEIGSKYGEKKGQGFILLSDEQRQPLLFSAEQLALNLAGRGVRLAVLGACEAGRRDQVSPWSGIAPALTAVGVPAVLGMQYVITDSGAGAFSRRFYRALAMGQTIDAAVTDGRLAIRNRGVSVHEWGVPVLYMRATEGVLFPQVQITTQENTWADVLKRAQSQVQRLLSEVTGKTKDTGVFLPAAYVRRAEMQKLLDLFLRSDTPALIIIGESGVGKSNLLMQWALDLLEAEHGVFIYDAGRSLRLEIGEEIVQDLSLANTDELLEAGKLIGELAERVGKQFVFIFDALNEFHDTDDVGPAALLKRLDTMITRLPNPNLRVAISCSAATWRGLERRGDTRLYWSHYFQPPAASSPAESRVVKLENFTPEEFRQAFANYKQLFQLHTDFKTLSPVLRERLRNPLLLRLLAETYKNRAEPIVQDLFTFGIFRRFYEERVRRQQDQLFVSELAAEMSQKQQITLAVNDLLHHPVLGPPILAEDPDSSYYRLLDQGILMESMGGMYMSDTVQFAYLQLGAYALARRLLSSTKVDTATYTTLVKQAEHFALAWDAAVALLTMQDQYAQVLDLAQAQNVEVRELVVVYLVNLYREEPDKAITRIEQLLQVEAPEAQRTSLKAAYTIGPRARHIFIQAVVKGSLELRQLAKNMLYLAWRTSSESLAPTTRSTLYLIWQHDPDFIYKLLQELLDQISFRSLGNLPQVLEFVMDLSITIYINHCGQQEVIQHTVDLYRDLALNHLHLNLLNTGILGSAFEKLVFRAVAAAFSRSILNTILFSEVVPADRFFKIPLPERACLARIADALEPPVELVTVRDDLKRMVQSDILFFRVAAGLAIAVHARRNFTATRSLITQLFDEVNSEGKLWLLLSFSVLLADTPVDWLDFVEGLTRRLVEEHPDIFYAENTPPFTNFDIIFVPLGLAYGKHRKAMTYFEQLLRVGLDTKNWRQVKRVLHALGPVGFYYPDEFFATLTATMNNIIEPQLQEALVHPLAIMRTLHFDTVDQFLNQINADDAFRRRVIAAANVDLVRAYIQWLGFYNNAVHFSLFYPKMRRNFSIGGLKLLATVSKPEKFIAEYTATAIRMFREAEFRLDRWTLPE
jgi:hypothetical protein